MLNKNKLFLFTDRAIVTCLCSAVFCLPAAKAAVEVFVWLAIFLWLLKRGLGYRAEAGILPKTALNKALGLFVAANALSVIFSVNHGLSLRGFFGKELKFMAIFFMVVEVINSRQRLLSVLIAIIASAGILIADAGMQYFRGADFLRGYSASMLQASFSNSNDFAGWLIMMIPVLGSLAVTKKRKGFSLKIKALLAVLIFLLFVCLLLTYSRGAWVGLLIGVSFGVCGIFKKIYWKTNWAILLIFLFLLGAILLLSQCLSRVIEWDQRFTLPFGQTIGERMKSIVLDRGGSGLFRRKLWQESLNIIEDFPVFGAGLNTYSRVAPNYKIFEGGGGYPHNSFLQMAAETGILGLLSFLWILFEFFKYAWRYVKEREDLLVLGLMSGILAFLVQSFVDTNLYALQMVVLFWFMLGLTVAVVKTESVSTTNI